MICRRACNPALASAALAFFAGFTETPVRGQVPPAAVPAGPRPDVEQNWEARFRLIPDAGRVKTLARAMSADPHLAGTPASRRVADYALARMREAGLNAWIEEHQALMPLPVERSVDVLGRHTTSLALHEPPVENDPDSADEGQVPTFNAYSADGDVIAEVVYVNYGTPEDFAQLEGLGVDVAGKIVLARYGRTWRGIKPKLAQEHGAIGCLIFSDPRDDGYWRGTVYPEGEWRPEQGVQRGSVLDMPVYPGDPLTPGWANEAGARQLTRAEARTLLKIPVLPISYGDALPILRELQGKVVPEEWRGALPVTYRVGPGPVRVRVRVRFDWQVRPLYNVLARIPGSTWPDQWVIYGNHHDAWVSGASDPVSGAAALLETARALGDLGRQGWRPQRTIVLALWDGEEWGLLGSTEWAEKHAAELQEKAVVYINSDSNGRGWLSAGGSPSLEPFVDELAGDLADPRSGRSLRDEAYARRLERAKAEERRATSEPPRLTLSPLGSGSDYTVFLDHLGVASLNVGFGGDGDGGVYHSIYDSFAWYTRFADTDFAYGATLARTVGTALIRLGGADLVPLRFGEQAAAVARYADEVERLYKAAPGAPVLDFAPLWGTTARLRRAADRYDALASSGGSGSVGGRLSAQALTALNRDVFTTERLWLLDEGLPGREWFKHALYAPGLYTGYGVKTLPGVREAIEQKDWEAARTQLGRLAVVADRVSGRVEAVAEQLARAAGTQTPR
jgi:N-acetylated-alpha-linked acidic dipeptidase